MAVNKPLCELCFVYVGAHPHVVAVTVGARQLRRLRVCARCAAELADNLGRELDRVCADLAAAV